MPELAHLCRSQSLPVGVMGTPSMTLKAIRGVDLGAARQFYEVLLGVAFTAE
jgi:hypothetical protein